MESIDKKIAIKKIWIFLDVTKSGKYMFWFGEMYLLTCWTFTFL